MAIANLLTDKEVIDLSREFKYRDRNDGRIIVEKRRIILAGRWK